MNKEPKGEYDFLDGLYEDTGRCHMMTTDIVNEIAHLIRQKDVSLKDPKEVKDKPASQAISEPHDEVTLTDTAQSYASASADATGYEKDQHMKVERLKSLVSSGNYKMDPQMVETIAERITKTFL